jgi:hypothetical protein
MNPEENANTEPGTKQVPDLTVKLNYIDKVHWFLTQQWTAVARAITVQLVLSLITVAICLGALTPTKNFSLFGLGLKASSTTVLVANTILIAALHVMIIAGVARAGTTGQELRRLYRELHYDDETLQPSAWIHPFDQPGPWGAIVTHGLYPREGRHWLAKLYEIGATFVVFVGLLVVLPLVAEVATLIKIASLMKWGENLLWVTLALPAMVSIMAIAWGFIVGPAQR